MQSVLLSEYLMLTYPRASVVWVEKKCLFFFFQQKNWIGGED